jgi:hypothetical protein
VTLFEEESGKWEEIGTQTVSSPVGTLIFNLSKTYKALRLVGGGFSSSSSTNALNILISATKGPPFSTTIGQIFVVDPSIVSGSAAAFRAFTQSVAISTATQDISFEGIIYRTDRPGTTPGVDDAVGFCQGASDAEDCQSFCIVSLQPLGIVNQVVLQFLAGNIDAGTATLYGLVA